MRLRATTYIRNDEMLEARKAKGWSQFDLAGYAGTSLNLVSRLERLDYPARIHRESIESLAGALEIEEEKVFPTELKGRFFATNITQFKDVDTTLLLEACSRRTQHLIAADPADKLSEKERNAKIEKILKTLSYREREIIRLRFGLNDGYCYTLQEIARIFRVTTTRVRQVEAKAIMKLQHPVRKQGLENL